MAISAMEFGSKAVAKSMASSCSTRLHLPTVASDICCARKGKLRQFCVKTGGDNCKVSADRVHGSKMNEVVHGIEASLTMGNGTAVLQDDDGGVMHTYRLGRFVEERYVYRQTFVIRSHEIGPDETATMETLMNLLQVLAFYLCIYPPPCHPSSLLQSVPVNVLENYHLTSMTLEYRRECRQSNLLESLTYLTAAEEDPVNVNTSLHSIQLRSTHLLCLQEDKAEVVRGRAKWKCK